MFQLINLAQVPLAGPDVWPVMGNLFQVRNAGTGALKKRGVR
jgi:hypothetical protein